MGVLETALQASARTLLLFPVEHLFDPATRFGKIWLSDCFRPMSQQAMQAQSFGTRVQSLKILHGRDP